MRQFAYLPSRKLKVVIAKLEPLSEQHALVKFFRNIDNAKTLSGFIQDLADAITDYQVRAAGLTVVFTDYPARFRCNKECTRGRGKFVMTPRTSSVTPGTSLTMPTIS
jgi:hypothetical protein